jgi:hypothetical protein
MALAAPQGPDKKRVKVYELKNNDWYDRGTGFCSGILLNVSWLDADAGTCWRSTFARLVSDIVVGNHVC